MNTSATAMEYVHPKHRAVGLPVEESRQQAENSRSSQEALVRESNQSEKYKKERKRAWDVWMKYALETNVPDPYDTFKGLCQYREAAMKEIIQFLKYHLRQSRAWRHCLGPEETKEVQKIKQATTIIAFWRALLVEADDRVLRPIREAHPNETGVWQLRWTPGGPSRAHGPVHEISEILKGSIADEFELNRKQSFVKREATVEDILLVLNVLWRRPDDIPCSPNERHAFHAAIIMAGLGFRPGSITKILYKQVELCVAPHPETGENTLHADVTVHHEKQETNKVYKTQDEVCTFRVFPVPSCQSLCLLSLISSRALADGACNPHFSSQKELLERPRLEGQSTLPIYWKPEFGDQPFFPITYDRYWLLWNLCWTVLGCEDKVRPYGLRVGAGIRYEQAALSDVMQNYVMSNSDKVRQASYQPRSISTNILALSYGLVDRDEVLRNALRNSSARRDENAPLYLAPGEADAFEERFGLTSLRQQYDQATTQFGSSDGRAKRLASDISGMIASLSKQKISLRRAEYFEAARVRRASGLPTDDLVQASVGPRKSRFSCSFPAAACISQFLLLGELGGERRTQIFHTLLQTFLSSQFAAVQALVEKLDETTLGTCDSLQQDVKSVCDDRPWRCLLCPPGTFFRRRHHFNRHHHYVHLKDSEKFSCPQCLREGRSLMVSGPGSAWSNHAERAHGKHTAPSPLVQLPKLNSLSKKVQCFFCDDPLELTAGCQLSRHFNKEHAPIIYSTFHCPGCRRSGLEEEITGQAAWLEHARKVHKCDERGFPIDTEKKTRSTRQKRKHEKIKGEDNQCESEEPPVAALVPSNKPCLGCVNQGPEGPGCMRRGGAGSCEECERLGIECLSRAGYGQTCSRCAAKRLKCWLRPGRTSCVACSTSLIICEQQVSKRKAQDSKRRKAQGSKRPATPLADPLPAIDPDCDTSDIDSAIDLGMETMSTDSNTTTDFDMMATDFDVMATDLDVMMGLSFDTWEIGPDFDASDFDEFPIDPTLLSTS